MTTYGTIPEQPSQGGPSLISRTRDRIQTSLGEPRPWKEMIQIQSINCPPSFTYSFKRIRTNVAFFWANYLIIALCVIFLGLLFHPIAQLIFIIIVASWRFLYFLREGPLSICGFAINDKIVAAILFLITFTVVFHANVKANIAIALSVGAAIVLLHAVIRSTDDLLFLHDEERVGYCEPAARPLKHPASSSYADKA